MKTLILLGAASLIATGALAQTPAAPAATAKPAVAAKPAAATKAPKAPKSAPAATGGRMVAATTKTGKKITYDCSKKGNLNKKACKA